MARGSRLNCAFEPIRDSTATEEGVAGVPSGKVKFFDTEKGFGFIAADDGQEVFVHASALPPDLPALRPGARVEFGIVEGRRGAQALSVRLLEPAPSVTKATRTPADQMAPLVEDLIKLLDGVSNSLRRGRYPDDARCRQVAKVLRAVADDLDVV